MTASQSLFKKRNALLFCCDIYSSSITKQYNVPREKQTSVSADRRQKPPALKSELRVHFEAHSHGVCCAIFDKTRGPIFGLLRLHAHVPVTLIACVTQSV
jgi:hypothetical protein